MIMQTSRFSFRGLFAGVVGLGLSMVGIDASAQQTIRPFQMSILASTDSVYNAGVDIPIFTRNAFSNYQDQPAGSSIAWLPIDRNLDRHNINWKHIVAVYVDEPYGEMLKNVSSCDSRIDATMQELEAMAAALRVKAPRARFWVNFTPKEVDLMVNPAANCPLNKPYFDVISMDVYNEIFYPTISTRYAVLYDHRATPYQQFAFVPGTFTGGDKGQNGSVGASRLSGYFDFAAIWNVNCSLPLGPTGKTGFYDGCLVWMVAGWIGGATPFSDGASVYYPIDHPNSEAVFDAWQAQFAIPPVGGPVSHTRAVMPLLLEE
jgi:hypothetical protein